MPSTASPRARRPGRPGGLAARPGRRGPELVAITAWTRQDTEAENIAVNGGAVRNLLAALEPAGRCGTSP